MASLVFNISSFSLSVEESPCGLGTFGSNSFWRFEIELGVSFIVDLEMGSVVVVDGTGIVVRGVLDSMLSSKPTVSTDMEWPPLLAWVAVAFAVGEFDVCWMGWVGRAAAVAMRSAVAVGTVVVC